MCGILDRLMADEQDSNDSDEVRMSAATLAALQEFHAEHSVTEKEVHSQSSHSVMPAEDWVTDAL